MSRLLLFALLTGVMFTGCAPRITESEFVRRNGELESIYYTGNKEAADASLRKQLVLISEAEAAGLKAFEYDKIRFYTYVQLSRLAKAMGKEDLAREEMNRAVRSFRRTSHSDAAKTDQELILGLIELADGVERENPPAWKNEPN